jgi:4-amino-4-deoxychorismate lyase
MMLINGIETDQVDARDRGFNYGDGVFTTLRVHQSLPVLWPRHLDRLHADCAQLGLVPPTADTLADDVQRVCSGVERGVVKIIITRGVGGRGYAPPRQVTPTRVVQLHPFPDYPARHWSEGVALRVCRTRLGRNPALAGAKHLNRLEQVLARGEWDDPAIAEGLMRDDAGHVIEATAANIFIVRAGALSTPSLAHCGVRGVMRAVVGELARGLNVEAREREIDMTDVERADEMFLTNSVMGIWPVRSVEGIELTVGAVTRRLQRALAREVPAYA